MVPLPEPIQLATKANYEDLKNNNKDQKKTIDAIYNHLMGLKMTSFYPEHKSTFDPPFPLKTIDEILRFRQRTFAQRQGFIFRAFKKTR